VPSVGDFLLLPELDLDRGNIFWNYTLFCKVKVYVGSGMIASVVGVLLLTPGSKLFFFKLLLIVGVFLRFFCLPNIELRD